jgi:ABC-type nitrate/sulfonate/bicarbonate transport system substrate-binding protein
MQSINRRLAAVVAAGAMIVAASTGCGGADSAGGVEVTELRYQGSVGQVTLPELAQDLGYLGDVKLKWIGNTISGPQDIQAATTGDTDFGGAFNGAIVKLAAAKAPIKAVIGYYGSNKITNMGFYVLDGSPIAGARDLIGKKIGVNTLGAHAEAVTKTYLSRNGLSPDEIAQVELVVVPPVNAEQSLRQGQIDVAALSQTLRDKAIARGGIHPLFTDYDLLGEFTAGSYVMRAEFIKQNPTTVRTFVTGVAKAVEWARTQPRDVVTARYADILRKRGRNEDTSLVQYWKSHGVAGKGGTITEAEFAVWIDWLTTAGELKGRQVEAKDVFTNEFNDLREGGAAR